jgi:hypothetical protein
MWDVIANMQDLEEVKVRFQALWMGWTVKDMFDPLWKVTRPLKFFVAKAPCETDEGRREMPFRLLGAG